MEGKAASQPRLRRDIEGEMARCERKMDALRKELERLEKELLTGG
jgi:hypothetical protein